MINCVSGSSLRSASDHNMSCPSDRPDLIRVRRYNNRRIEEMAREKYPETKLLKQVKGVGDLIATTYVLTIEDPHRFRKSRDAGCFVGLQPGRRNSGDSEPQ